MERLDIILATDEGDRRYDEILDNSLPENADLEIVLLKRRGTANGGSCVMLTFTVELPDGTLQRVQTVTTAKLFVTAAKAIEGALQRGSYI